MSVLIRDMDKPEKCGECKFFHILNLDSWCCVTDERIDDEFGVLPDDCPLVEVKTPHGDLADVSEVKKCLHDLPDSEDKWSAIALLEWAMEKRTVIEAEG